MIWCNYGSLLRMSHEVFSIFRRNRALYKQFADHPPGISAKTFSNKHAFFLLFIWVSKIRRNLANSRKSARLHVILRSKLAPVWLRLGLA